MDEENGRNIILSLSKDFAIKIADFCDVLEQKKKHIISRQLLRSGTSIGANIREAQNAESRKDFIHKMKLAAKEAEETEYWLSICNGLTSYPKSQNLSTEIRVLIKILSKIITTSITNSKT